MRTKMQKFERRNTYTPTDASLVCSPMVMSLNREETLSEHSLKTLSNNSEENYSQHRGSPDLRVQNIVYVLNMRGRSTVERFNTKYDHIWTNNNMKPSDWARKQGINYKTPYRLYRSGKFPRPTEQLQMGTILVHEIPTKTNNTALYGRVSSANQKSDLERQMQRLRDYAAARGLKVVSEVREIGSGLNGRRKKLLKLLANPLVSIIVVEHRDRLARFGAEFISAALVAADRQLQVINQAECNDDLVQDMVDVLTSFCARLYGKRAAKNRTKRALEATKDVD